MSNRTTTTQRGGLSFLKGKFRLAAAISFLLVVVMAFPQQGFAIDCTSDNIASWSVDTCVSDSVFWDGFIPELGASACAGVSVSELKRSAETNACAPSRPGGDGIAISTAKWGDPVYEAGSAKAITFELSYPAGQQGAIEEFSFWERAPLIYATLPGSINTSDRPQKFGLRVVKNGCEIFRQIDIATSLDWAQQTFDFSGNAGFKFDGLDTIDFVFELFAYADSDSLTAILFEEIWELDDFEVNGYCGPCTPPVVVCTDDVVASWPVDSCAADTAFWDSFNAIPGPVCSGVNASPLSRLSAGNFCTDSRAGADGFAIATTDWAADTFVAGASNAVVFQIDYPADVAGEVGEVCFWETAPANYLFASGAAGVNDRPEKFGVRVLKDGVEIFRQTEMPTSSGWAEHCFDFTGDPLFQFDGVTNFTFEFFAYADTDTTAGLLEVWNLDDFQLTGNCGDCLTAGVDSVNVFEDIATVLDLLANDNAAAGFDTTSFALMTVPPSSKGTAVSNGDGSITFTSALNYCGEVDPFDYEITDMLGNVLGGKVVVKIDCVDDVPIAVDDNVSIKSDTITIIDFLANDIDVDGDVDPTTMILTTSPPASQGTVVNNGDGTVTFFPDTAYLGPVDAFAYAVSDTSGNTVSASANIVVSVAPSANNDSDTTMQDVPIIIDVTANDFDTDNDLDPNSLILFTTPPFSQGIIINNGNGTVTFVPAPGFSGPVDPWVYRISDEAGNISFATVSIFVIPADGGPLAVDDTDFVCNAGVTTTAVLANDSDSIGVLDPNSVTILSPPTNGTATVSGAGSISYMHDGSASTTDSYTYIVANDLGQTDTADVSIAISNLGAASTITTMDATDCDLRDGGVIVDLDPTALGSPPYTITVNGGLFTAGPYSSEPINVIGAPGGSTVSSFVLSDANGCSMEMGPITIGGPARPRIDTIDFPAAVCGDLGGDILLGIADLRSGTAPYTVQLFPSGTVYGPFPAEPITLDDVPFGSYTSIKIFDANGCGKNNSIPFDILEPTGCSECPAPINLGTIVNGGKTADLSWDVVAEAVAYEIRIRPVGDTSWVNVPPQAAPFRRVGSLSPLTAYEWQVRSICGTEFSDWSSLETFTTVSPRLETPATTAEIFPNPASEQFTISFTSNSAEDAEVYIYLYDQIGRLVLSRMENSTSGINTFQFSSSELAAGIYDVVIHLQGEHGSLSHATEKLIIKQ